MVCFSSNLNIDGGSISRAGLCFNPQREWIFVAHPVNLATNRIKCNEEAGHLLHMPLYYRKLLLKFDIALIRVEILIINYCAIFFLLTET